MPAADVITYKAVWLQELDAFLPFWDAMVEAMQHPDVGEPLLLKSTNADNFRASMKLATRASENFYVSADMMKLAVAASDVLPDDAEVKPQSLPSPQGFMMFATPYRIWDVRGHMLVINGVLWTQFGGGVSLLLLVDKYDPLEQAAFAASMYRLGRDPAKITDFPRLSPIHVSRITFNQPLPQSIQLTGAKPIPPEVNVQVKKIDGNIVWSSDDEGFSPEGLLPKVGVDKFSKFITTIWRLMRQTLVDVREEEVVDKRSRRLADKHLNSKRHVTIIALRRTEYHGQGDREWVLDHRVLVRGYHRRQWYGSGEDRWFDYIYVHPHLRGPEGAPLIVTDKVNALIR